MKLNLIHYAILAFVTLVVIESIVAAYHQREITWKARWMYLFAPPGWSHDGSTKTLKQAKHSLDSLRNDKKNENL